MIGTIRRHRGLLAAKTSSVFTATFLLLALQPCVASVGPPAHDAHGGDCPHCAVTTGPACMDTAVMDCGPDDDALTSKPEHDDMPHPAAIAEMPLPVTPADGAVSHLLTRLEPESTGPPLSIRFCCFLE